MPVATRGKHTRRRETRPDIPRSRDPEPPRTNSESNTLSSYVHSLNHSGQSAGALCEALTGYGYGYECGYAAIRCLRVDASVAGNEIYFRFVCLLVHVVVVVLAWTACRQVSLVVDVERAAAAAARGQYARIDSQCSQVLTWTSEPSRRAAHACIQPSPRLLGPPVFTLARAAAADGRRLRERRANAHIVWFVPSGIWWNGGPSRVSRPREHHLRY